MAGSGMQVFDSSGRILVDMTVSFSLHQGSVDTGAVNGAATMPPLPSGKSRFYYVTPLQDMSGWKGKLPGVTVSGNSITWAYQHSTWFGQFSANCRIYYGYY